MIIFIVWITAFAFNVISGNNMECEIIKYGTKRIRWVSSKTLDLWSVGHGLESRKVHEHFSSLK